MIWNRATHLALLALVCLPMGAGAGADSIQKREDGVTVVQLTQTPCLFQESEQNPEEYTSHSKADCVAINARTSGDRKLETLRLAPGRTIFRVTNQSVPYTVGFWVRGSGLGRLTLPSASGGGLTPGTTEDYEIDLRPGTYVYSCPLNPTPGYTLVVE